MYIEIDDKSGFCFGVVNAITRAEESLCESGGVYSLGDIVHNRVEMRRLEEMGLGTVSTADFGGLGGCTVLFRAHGEPPATYSLAEAAGIKVVDATCPVVARLQDKVKDAYARMSGVGGQVVILGKRGHAEVVGLAGQVGGDVVVVEGVDDLGSVDFSRPVYFLSQTTQSLVVFSRVRDEILKRAFDPSAVTVDDTICRQVSNRAPHLREFAKRFDVVVFVSGRESSNGKVLFGACLEANPRSYKIEDAGDLKREWFENCGSVGICGATSTPKWLMERVADAVAALCG